MYKFFMERIAYSSCKEETKCKFGERKPFKEAPEMLLQNYRDRKSCKCRFSCATNKLHPMGRKSIQQIDRTKTKTS